MKMSGAGNEGDGNDDGGNQPMNSTANDSGINASDLSWNLNLSDDTVLGNEANESAMDTSNNENPNTSNNDNSGASEMMDVDQNESFGHTPDNRRRASYWIMSVQYNNLRGRCIIISLLIYLFTNSFKYHF